MTDIYKFVDFRKYLQEYYRNRKSQDAAYSYKRLAIAAKLGSPNYPKLVMDGDRALTVANIHRFAQALDLGFVETQYFEALVLMAQAETPKERAFYQTRVHELAKAHRPTAVRSSGSTELLDHPSTTAVIVCLHGLPVDENLEAIAKKTALNKDRVREIIRTLKKENLLSEVDGKFSLTEKYIQFQDKKAKSPSQRKYLRAQLDKSIHALETRYAKDAKFYCNTFTIAENSLEILQDRIGEWLDGLMDQTNLESPDRIVQLNLQLFPYA